MDAKEELHKPKALPFSIDSILARPAHDSDEASETSSSDPIKGERQQNCKPTEISKFAGAEPAETG